MAEDDVKPIKAKRPSGLGRGLSALLGDIEREEPVRGLETQGSGVQMLPVSDLHPHPDQPRRYFDDSLLDELARSITARGVLQPIVVRPHDGGYQIVAGERRWRAAQRASLHQVPVIIKEFDDATTLEVALIENIQRHDLNAIEEGEAYRRLISEYGHSQEALGKIVHKSRSHVANLMRLLDLPVPVRDSIATGELSMGHARAMLGVPDPLMFMVQILKRGLSVRETEALARKAKVKPPSATPRASARHDPDLDALERHLGDLLGLKVRINHGQKSGAITLNYSSLDQLDLICQRLSGEKI
jgi:ParB family transcriptional regulator, chromosome partitioning protein